MFYELWITVVSSLSLGVTKPPSVVWLRDCDQQLCVYGLGLGLAVGTAGFAF